MDEFKMDEKLFRKVNNTPQMWKDGRPSSAVFKDSQGCSVDRDLNRREKESVNTLLERWNVDEVKAIVNVTVNECLDATTWVKYDPKDENQYHSTINRSNETAALSKSQARNISKCCRISYYKNT